MNRDEQLENFYISQFRDGMETLRGLDRFCWEYRDCFKEKLEFALKKLTANIASAQQAKTKGDIFCISLCFFRSKFILREGIIRIYGFDKRFFLDPDPLWEEIDINSECSFIWELEDKMERALSEDRNGVTESDVRTIIQLEYVPLLVGYITELARYAIRKGEPGYLADIIVTDDFSIMAGEYQESFDQIYVTEAVDTGGKSLKKFLGRCEAGDLALVCKRYKNETLENMDLSGLNFTKSHFEQVKLCSSSLKGSNLLKTEWVNCSLIYNIWEGAYLFGASFHGSDLTGSNFSSITAPVIPPSFMFPSTLSWCGLDFTDTNLCRVKFAGADLRGADFRGAAFHQTDFSGALLNEAIFTPKGCLEAGLSDEQIKIIKIEG